MAAVAAYKTWLGTQGRVYQLVREDGWIPPPVLQKLDEDLPDAVGHVILHLGGRGALETIVFQLPSHPDLYFNINFGTWNDLTLDESLKHGVHVYAVAPPTVNHGLIMDEFGPEKPLAKVSVTQSFTELRDFTPPEGAVANAKMEVEMKVIASAKPSSGCILL